MLLKTAMTDLVLAILALTSFVQSRCPTAGTQNVLHSLISCIYQTRFDNKRVSITDSILIEQVLFKIFFFFLYSFLILGPTFFVNQGGSFLNF